MYSIAVRSKKQKQGALLYALKNINEAVTLSVYKKFTLKCAAAEKIFFTVLYNADLMC